MMIKSIFLTLKRIFTGINFRLCCIIVFTLCFTAEVGTARNGDPLNVLNYIFGDNGPISAEQILGTRGGSWLFMFMPIISGLCFVNAICDDKSSRFLRYEIFRAGYFRFKAAKYISSAASSGVCALVGFVPFAVFVELYFPKDDFFEINLAAIFAEMFVFGIMSAVPALITAAFTNNKYLIVCVPFMLKYCMTQIALRITTAAYENIGNPNLTLGKIGRIIDPNSISSVFSYPDRIGIILTNAALLLGGFAIYLFRKGGADKGE